MERIAIECINSADLSVPETYSQVVVVTGADLIFIAGEAIAIVHG